MTTQLWRLDSGQHVPGFVLTYPVLFRGIAQFRPHHRRDDVNDWVYMDHPGPAVDLPECITARDRRLDELRLQFGPAPIRKWPEPSDLTGRPAKKRNLVNRRIEREPL